MTNEKPLVTVIVPAYNSAEYLLNNIKTIVQQTYKNIEVIVVDDGSIDSSNLVYNELCELDSRIKVYSQANLGLSAARNLGLLNAKGSFLMFMDSDDFFLEQNTIELCIEKMSRERSELLVFGFELFYEHKDAKIKHVTSDINGMYSSVWNKVYSKHLINNLKFPVAKYYEDMGFVLQCTLRAKKISVIDQPFYAYVQRSGSIASTKGHYLKHLDIIDVLKPVFLSQDYADATLIEKKRVQMFVNYQIITHIIVMFYEAPKGLDITDAIQKLFEFQDDISDNSKPLFKATSVSNYFWGIINDLIKTKPSFFITKIIINLINLIRSKWRE